MRPAPTLGEPGDLAGFPAVRPPASLFRVYRRPLGTWFFSSSGAGRFDLEPPEGTCHFAADPYGAVREASRLGPVTPHWLLGRDLREVAPPDPNARLAATHVAAAGAYGLTMELVTHMPYDLPRRWAAAFRAAGFRGLRHQLRHDPRARPAGVSLFGPAGPADTPDGRRQPLDPALLAAAGVRVLEAPHSGALTIEG
ncbi:MAG TPA: RES domain-containing protein [Thermoanaerobaculia bacterium]|nr:RES domain-containing protein [Thermoanaerobaculia bacterium]